LQLRHDYDEDPRCNVNHDNTDLSSTVANPLLYVLHSGQLFGTERMAVATLAQLSSHFDGTILAPPGPVHDHAHKCGVRTVCITSAAALALHLWRTARATPRFALMTTSVSQSLTLIAIQALCHCEVRHLHIVHGGTEERLSYGRKRLLSRFFVEFVAVSEFVRERLVAHGVQSDRISVVENFLAPASIPQRPPFCSAGVQRVVTLSRTDRIKRVGLLLQAVRHYPELGDIQFDIYGSGEEDASLQAACVRMPNVRLHGFDPQAAQKLGEFDLLVHTCAEEPFGLVVLEAFAAGVPVLVPNAGGVARLVRDGDTGWYFAANDPMALGTRLCELRAAPPDLLNGVARRARAELANRFTPACQAARYCQILWGS
jgi:glycosyltransferase involved in cell wall biosynthesis